MKTNDIQFYEQLPLERSTKNWHLLSQQKSTKNFRFTSSRLAQTRATRPHVGQHLGNILNTLYTRVCAHRQVDDK